MTDRVALVKFLNEQCVVPACVTDPFVGFKHGEEQVKILIKEGK